MKIESIIITLTILVVHLLSCVTFIQMVQKTSEFLVTCAFLNTISMLVVLAAYTVEFCVQSKNREVMWCKRVELNET